MQTILNTFGVCSFDHANDKPVDKVDSCILAFLMLPNVDANAIENN